MEYIVLKNFKVGSKSFHKGDSADELSQTQKKCFLSLKMIKKTDLENKIDEIIEPEIVEPKVIEPKTPKKVK